MLTNFVQQKIAKAKYKKLGDGSYFGSIPGLKGVWANAATREACKKELWEVLEEWLVLKLRSGDRVPGLSFSFTSSKLSHLLEGQYA